jgi:hypothetical protein
MGGIPELLDSENGVTFQVFDKEAMSTAITMSMTRQWNHEAIASHAMQRFAPEGHLRTLMNDIYGF